jgi:2-isopropylmalate synthase
MTTSTTTNTGKDRVFIFDTTMRDGEQSPGASMTLREKLELAELLQEMKVDICEAGFAASSEGDFQCVSQIAELAKDMSICTLARSTLTDIDKAGEALRKAKNPRIHTFISTSPVHMKHKLKMGENAVLEAVGASVTGAQIYRRSRMVGRRRHAHRVRFPLHAASMSPSTPAPR